VTYLYRDHSTGFIIQSDHPLPAPGCTPTCSTRTHGHCGRRGCSPHRYPDAENAQSPNSVDTDAAPARTTHEVLR
jgi:hypothetical protein